LAPIATGSTQRIEVRTSGTQLTGWWNGTQVVSATDSVQQAATRHGIDWNSAFDPTARFDNRRDPQQRRAARRAKRAGEPEPRE
jgi:hypothetical protein